jgi:acyl-CoA synthetase (AMP-forming)/AMP-acid ligase II
VLLQTLHTQPWLPKPNITQLFLGGERLSCELVEDTLRTFPGLHLWNLYGPTEATANALAASVRTAEQKVSLGRPVANACVHLLNLNLSTVPRCVPGEICIGGAGVGRCYVNRPDLTAERFVPDPFSERPGARMYRTGDLARLLSENQVEFLGRRDSQLKIRGYRVEPGEVEIALQAHPSVQEAAVQAREYPDGPRLVAYLVKRDRADINTTAIKDFLMTKLPSHMIPSIFFHVEDLPRLASGKKDYRSLPTEAEELPVVSSEFLPPSNPLEERLAQIWSQMLGVPRVGRSDNFFDLGGHSLLATQMISRIPQSSLGEVPLLTLFFEQPTVAALAEALLNSLPPGTSPEDALALFEDSVLSEKLPASREVA